MHVQNGCEYDKSANKGLVCGVRVDGGGGALDIVVKQFNRV